MIPVNPLILNTRPATLLAGSLPMERHGDDRVAFLDVRLSTLIDTGEIDYLFDPRQEMLTRPSETIFNPDTDANNAFWLPALHKVASLRSSIKGVLKLGEWEFEGAHVVGQANTLGFQTGGHGVITATFRLSIGNELRGVVALVESGETLFSFTEYPDNKADPADAQQEQMAV